MNDTPQRKRAENLLPPKLPPPPVAVPVAKVPEVKPPPSPKTKKPWITSTLLANRRKYPQYSPAQMKELVGESIEICNQGFEGEPRMAVYAVSFNAEKFSQRVSDIANCDIESLKNNLLVKIKHFYELRHHSAKVSESGDGLIIAQPMTDYVFGGKLAYDGDDKILLRVENCIKNALPLAIDYSVRELLGLPKREPGATESKGR